MLHSKPNLAFQTQPNLLIPTRPTKPNLMYQTRLGLVGQVGFGRSGPCYALNWSKSSWLTLDSKYLYRHMDFHITVERLKKEICGFIIYIIRPKQGVYFIIKNKA